MISILDVNYDEVIKSVYALGRIDYKDALKMLYPAINKMDQQRYTLKTNLYERLKKDIVTGCIMPPITIAIKSADSNKLELDTDSIQNFINSNIKNVLILDGIQRLNTLNSVEVDIQNNNKPIYVNILICNSINKLIYRMITLNNGQKPMSVRHQIEVLADNIYDFRQLDMKLVTEKQTKEYNIKGGFSKADIVKAYLAFISGSTNIDNQKIIESKMDELITDKIIDSSITNLEVEFTDIMYLVNQLCNTDDLYQWFKVTNNMIGFCAGISKSYNDLSNDIDGFGEVVSRFEKAFSGINISKIKLGTARRNAVSMLIKKYSKYKELKEMELMDKISEEI